MISGTTLLGVGAGAYLGHRLHSAGRDDLLALAVSAAGLYFAYRAHRSDVALHILTRVYVCEATGQLPRGSLFEILRRGAR